MYISSIEIKDFRAFSDTSNESNIQLGQYITCLAGHNGVGKSTVLALLSNCGELKGKVGKHLNGDTFRGEYSTIIKGDKKFDSSGPKCTLRFSDLPKNENKDNPFVNELVFRATFQNSESAKDHFVEWDDKNNSIRNYLVKTYIKNELDNLEHQISSNQIESLSSYIIDLAVNWNKKLGHETREVKHDLLFNSLQLKMTELKIIDDETTFNVVVENITRTLLLESFQDLFRNGLFVKQPKKDIKTRYRLIPQKSELRNTEKKLEWPTYYLGLSRLFPIGEADEANEKKIDTNIMDKVLQQHRKILNSNDEGITAKGVDISNVSKKTGFGVETKKYGSLSNSSGQDNLGQILLTIESFRLLKTNLREKYNGGIFLIDEIDATLHPSAQNKLFDYLYSQSKELSLQIVFTSHSLSLIEHIIKTSKLSEKNNAVKLIYFTNSRGSLEAKENPDMSYINNDMMMTYSGQNESNAVDLLSEDDTARWFLKQIIKTSDKNIKLNYLNLHIGWEQLVSIVLTDYTYFQKKIILLDPDLVQDDNSLKLSEMIKHSRFKFNQDASMHTSRILSLPGDKAIEEVFWYYLDSLKENHKFFFDPDSEALNITKRSIVSCGPFENQNYKDAKNDLAKIKRWFEDNMEIVQILFKYWYTDNNEQVNNFLNILEKEYKKVLNRNKNF